MHDRPAHPCGAMFHTDGVCPAGCIASSDPQALDYGIGERKVAWGRAGGPDPHACVAQSV